METKECTGCGITKPLNEYSPHPKCAMGVYPKCKQCRAEVSRAYYYANREKLLAQQKGSKRKAQYVRRLELKIKYGLTSAGYEALVESQLGLCAICMNFERVLHVDHDHETGEIRGLLCKRCNLAIGMFKDNPFLCLNAFSYLKKANRHPENR